jgi:hypothetical protein
MKKLNSPTAAQFFPFLSKEKKKSHTQQQKERENSIISLEFSYIGKMIALVAA